MLTENILIVMDPLASRRLQTNFFPSISSYILITVKFIHLELKRATINFGTGVPNNTFIQDTRQRMASAAPRSSIKDRLREPSHRNFIHCLNLTWTYVRSTSLMIDHACTTNTPELDA